MMAKASLRFSVLLITLAIAVTVSAQNFVRVKRVIDGDTLQLESGERVRLLGVNTPETKHPKKQAEYFGKEASAFTKRMVEGKLVRLEYDSLAGGTRPERPIHADIGLCVPRRWQAPKRRDHKARLRLCR